MRRTKYNNKKVIVDDIKFDSKKEAEHYLYLKKLEAAGEIHTLRLQPRFKLEAGGRPIKIRSKRYKNGRVATYVADFDYLTADGVYVIVDVKGYDTDLSRLKRATLEAMLGIEITIV